MSHLGELWDTLPIGQDQGLLADKIAFMVPCLPEIIVHSLLPRLQRACYTGPKELLPFLCNLDGSDLSVKCYKVVLEFY